MELLVATQNPGKLAEFRAMLHPLGIEVVTPDQIGLSDLDVEETGETFADNAFLKAKAFAEASGKVSLADDSGLEVSALDGKPGVYSKRVGQNDPERIQWLLTQLKNITDRSAQFTSALCLFDPQTQTAEFFTGVIRGQIGNEARGTQGFGYDPVFIPEEYQETFAELGAEVKNGISHRARALQALQAFFKAN